MTRIVESQLYVIDETNGEGLVDPAIQMSIFLCAKDEPDFVGTHITMELIDRVMDRVDEDANIEVIICRNIEGENLLGFRHKAPEGLDWADEAEHWQQALREEMDFPA